jgi:hypothetical protein
MSDERYQLPLDTRFVISMMPSDLRQEIYEILRHNPDHEEALWWNTRGDDDYEQLAYSMMNDDYLWNVWRECFYRSLTEEMRHIKARENKEAETE